MQTFTIDPRRWWIARIFSTNPLVRSTDRVEALALLLAIVFFLVALPISGAVATAVHDSHARLYASQASTRYPATATVIDETGSADPNGDAVVQGTWFVNGSRRTASFQWSGSVKTAERVKIWVDSTGNRVDPPTPVSRAGLDAVNAALAITFLVVTSTVAVLSALHWLLERIRYAGLDREIRGLVGDDSDRGGTDPGRL